MSLQVLIPNLFYADVLLGLEMFVDCLGFEIVYSEPGAPQPFYILRKDAVKAYLIQDPEFAAKDRPELRIETDDIDGVYRGVKEKNPELIHPNLREVTLREWGAREFAVRDRSGVCIVFMQW